MENASDWHQAHQNLSNSLGAMTLQRHQGQNWKESVNGNGIEWDGMECFEIGMK